MNEIVEKCFKNDINFQTQRDEGFKFALNLKEKNAALLAHYVDYQFVKGY